MFTYAGPRQPSVGSQASARLAYTNQAFAGRAHWHAVRRAERRAGPLAVAPACVAGWPSPEPGVSETPRQSSRPGYVKPVDASCGFR